MLDIKSAKKKFRTKTPTGYFLERGFARTSRIILAGLTVSSEKFDLRPSHIMCVPFRIPLGFSSPTYTVPALI